MSKHTTGPWELMDADRGGLIVGAGGEHLATINNYYRDHASNVANGTIMAAAPDLLEALKPFAEIAAVFDMPGGTQPTKGEIYTWSRMVDGEPKDYTLTVEMLRAARAAILKAES